MAEGETNVLLTDGLSNSGSPTINSLKSVRVGRRDERMCLLARFFSGFDNPTRVSLLLLLARQGEMKVMELVEELEVPQPRISEHLRILMRYGCVKVRREGRHAHYSVADERVMQMIGLGESLMFENRAR